MTRRVLLILVILTAFVTVVYSHRRKHRHCPSRDDDDHVCCDWKTMSYLETRQTCELCTQPTSANPLCGQLRARGRVYNYCLYRYTVNVTVVTCNPRCCDGWTIDEHGECSIRSDQPKPDIVCENGGSPANDYCICPAGFSGKNCETAVCNPPCLNSGMCGGRNGAAVCVCPAKFTGKQCETPICEPACQNGGTCTGYYDMECRCPPGFAGKACEYEIKDGDCPKYPGTGACYNDCQIDHDCPGTKKCCPNACGGNVCTYPAKTTCTYNGSNYTVGQVLQMTPCKTCFCKNPDSDIINQWECLEMGCPNLPCPFTKTMPGMCCPVCDDVPTTAKPSPTTPIPTIPIPPKITCTENGIEYPILAEIKRNNGCETCICSQFPSNTSDTLASLYWKCMAVTCLWIPTCTNLEYIPGVCCPTCQDPPTTTPAPTTEPPTTQQPTTRQPPTTQTTTQPNTRQPPTTQTTTQPNTRQPPTTQTTTQPTTKATTIKQTCQENNVEYPIGYVMSKNNNCEFCECVIGSPQWACRHVDCPKIACEYQTTIEGECCPMCYGIEFAHITNHVLLTNYAYQ